MGMNSKEKKRFSGVSRAEKPDWRFKRSGTPMHSGNPVRNSLQYWNLKLCTIDCAPEVLRCTVARARCASSDFTILKRSLASFERTPSLYFKALSFRAIFRVLWEDFRVLLLIEFIIIEDHFTTSIPLQLIQVCFSILSFSYHCLIFLGFLCESYMFTILRIDLSALDII